MKATKLFIIFVSIVVFVALYVFFGQSNNTNSQNILSSENEIPVTNAAPNKTSKNSSLLKTSVDIKNTEMDESVRQAVNEIVNTSSEGLVEVQTDDGAVVDLKGRFRSVPVATIGADGEITIIDYTSKVADQK